jgi:HAD superfamily hydrolase (TIGR01549 family)
MTPTDPQRLLGLLRGVDAVLFDFDGPLCHLFDAYPAADVAEEMKRFLRAAAELPEAFEFEAYDDTHLLLHDAAASDVPHPVLTGLEALLSKAEERAAAKAPDTAGAVNLIRTLHRANRPIAIATNNSPGAVRVYLKIHGVEGEFDGKIFGRGSDPQLMKPDPSCLTRALRELEMETTAGNCLMIGDSVNDLLAARGAGVPFLAYAKSDRKEKELTSAGADVVVRHMDQVTDGFLRAGL